MKAPRIRRPDRSALVLIPNGLTLFNLFAGINSIVLSSKGRFASAALWIVIGGVADALDGRVARATSTGSRFGEELDSLVDAISFGLAPALIMYFAVLNREGGDWVYVFLFTACAVIRLARFNVEQAGSAKTHFHGLPSPAAGMTLASYYWFSQTPLYNQTVIFLTESTTLADLPWHVIMRVLMIALAFFMISNIPYPAVPTLGIKSPRQIIASVLVLVSILGLIFVPDRTRFIFPALLIYVLVPPVQTAILGFLDRREPDIFLEEEPDDEGVPRIPQVSAARRTPSVAMVTGSVSPTPDASSLIPRRRRRRKRPRGDRPHGGGAPDSPRPGTPPFSQPKPQGTPPREGGGGTQKE